MEVVMILINSTTFKIFKYRSLQNAFGFDSEESEEEDFSCCGESIISPVKKVPTSFLEVSKPYDSR